MRSNMDGSPTTHYPHVNVWVDWSKGDVVRKEGRLVYDFSVWPLASK